MELWEAMEQRHSVRAYQDRPIAGEVKEELELGSPNATGKAGCTCS